MSKDLSAKRTELAKLLRIYRQAPPHERVLRVRQEMSRSTKGTKAK